VSKRLAGCDSGKTPECSPVACGNFFNRTCTLLVSDAARNASSELMKRNCLRIHLCPYFFGSNFETVYAIDNQFIGFPHAFFTFLLHWASVDNL